ncbi:MAG: phosphatidylethanolamine N-methyltransferase family protein [Burkholderiales bacterium]|jgi:hypothetical protein|nr:phosphatidylethanolamine N-methyltransferase family protein [Burkholderiales bacterium]
MTVAPKHCLQDVPHQPPSLTVGLLPHCAILAVLLIGVFIASQNISLSGSFLGLATPVWLIVATVVPILHQFYVWFCWRVELNTHAISQYFGAQTGFRLYAAIFILFFASRFFSIAALAYSNAQCAPGGEHMRIAGMIVACFLFAPSFYLIYSVHRYFGFTRAFGIDHFEPDTYRDIPFVKQGIFRFSQNAMYVYGFLMLWIPAFWFLSPAALVSAAFSHLYIWAHYFCTELPDIRFIYADRQSAKQAAKS